MSGTRPAIAPDDSELGAWTNETLPLSLRKELLDRELKKLGFRKAAVDSGATHAAGTVQQQQQPQLQPRKSHPQADGDSEAHCE